ncbi:MAG: O-antigen ligase family protein [Chthoniobacterales bacterium]
MDKIARFFEGLSFLLLITAFVAIQVMIGGTRMVFSLPSYALLAVVGLLSILSLRRMKPAPSMWCLSISTAFFAYILARAYLSPMPYIARSDLYSVLAGLVVYFYTACILTNARQRMIFLGCLLALAIGHALIGASQFRDGKNFMPIPWLQRYDYGARASGFYICPNHLAGLLEALGVLGLSLVCWSRLSNWIKLLLGYAVAVCYVAIVLTGSRGGYLSTTISLLVFALLSAKLVRRVRGRLFWSLGGVGILAAAILAVAVTAAVKRSPYLTNRAQNTFELSNMRVDLWNGALQQWKLEPIFGTGSGTYLYYGRLFRTERVQQDPIYVHNDYLNLLAEYGAVGAVGMALFLAAHLYCGVRTFRRLGPQRVAISQQLLSNALALNIGALAAVSSYLAHSVVDFNLHIPGNLLFMAFVFGLLANDGVSRENEPGAQWPNKWWWRFALPILGGVLIIQAVRLFPGEYCSERARMAVRDQHGAVGVRFALQGLKYDPENPDLYYRLGMARNLLGDAMDDPEARASFYREGIAALQQARSLAPREEIYALELASALDISKRFDEAEQVYNDAINLDPNSISIRRYYENHIDLWERSAEPEKTEPEKKS